MFPLLLLLIAFCFNNSLAENCSYEPVIRGVHINQTLGDLNRQIFPNSTKCKEKCLLSEFFNCTAVIWDSANQLGPCFILDSVNTTNGIITNNSSFILHIKTCGNDTIPSVQPCTFEATESLISVVSNNISFSESSSTADCENLCISTLNCQSFIISETTCHLYAQTPTSLEGGDSILYTKTCESAIKNCIYTSWSEWTTCSECSQSRTRTVLEQAEDGGVACSDNESYEQMSCNCNSSSVRISRSSSKINKVDCDYSNWSEWDNCDEETCLIIRNRTSQKCDFNVDKLPCNCSGSATSSQTIKETGCRIENFSLFSRPSSKGMKVIPNPTSSCANACASETSFICEAFSLPVSGNGSCILYGEIDQYVIQTDDSTHFLQDVFCTTEGQGADKLCEYSFKRPQHFPNLDDPTQYRNITLGVNETCETYNLRNGEFLSDFYYMTYMTYDPKVNKCIIFNPQEVNDQLKYSMSWDSFSLQCSKMF